MTCRIYVSNSKECTCILFNTKLCLDILTARSAGAFFLAANAFTRDPEIKFLFDLLAGVLLLVQMGTSSDEHYRAKYFNLYRKGDKHTYTCNSDTFQTSTRVDARVKFSVVSLRSSLTTS